MNTLTTNTINILKNFSGINRNLLVKEGNQLSTIAEAKNILAFATVDETFDQEFGIYDLSEFLSAYDLLDDPQLEFSDSSVNLSSGRSKVCYRFADKSTLTFPQSKINMPTPNLTVKISAEVLSSIKKAASAFSHTVTSIKRDGEAVVISVVDPKNPTANTYSVELSDKTDLTASFDFQFLIANLKVIPGDYTVDISSKFISHWVHDTENIEYYIALEKTSSFDA